ncbi:MAG: DUF86 domain-containing protein [Nanohaloarchaea archaeon SW_7_43_1]|nr:MAG: DUF86 domain-containing protein [Nanohaloarchaea archaeon SW_7_43_1]
MDLIEESIRKLKDEKVNQDDFYHFQGLKHTLQEAVEASIDISSQIISRNGWGREESYSDYFQTLGKNNVIEKQLVERLKQMAKFRNLVVHRYMEVDEEELQKIIDEDLNDLLEFVEQIEEYRNKE